MASSGRRVLAAGCTAVLLVAIVFNAYLVHMGAYLANQINSGSSGNLETALQFPFFLLPTGPANLWGVIPLGHIPDEPYLSVGIVIGAVLTLVAALACLWMVPKRQPAAAVMFVMCGAATVLFMNRQGFGLFKMSMFIQPFLCCVLAAAARSRADRGGWRCRCLSCSPGCQRCQPTSRPATAPDRHTTSWRRRRAVA
jgi:hypothetical protein